MLFLVLLQSVLLLALLGAAVYWRIQTQRDLEQCAAIEREHAAALKSLQSVVAGFQVEISEIRHKEPQAVPAPPAPPIELHSPQPAQTLSLAKRSQALKMLRRGEPVETVSAATGIPQSQIRLLKKVQALIEA